MGLETSREWVDLDWLLDAAGLEWTGEPHIIFDEDVTPQFRLRRQLGHDGTLWHTSNLAVEVLRPLVTSTIFLGELGLPKNGQTVRYTVGPIKVCSVFKPISMRAGKFPGKEERIIIPGRCDYVPGERCENIRRRVAA